MKWFWRLLTTFSFVALLVAPATASAQAAAGGFIINDFHGRYELFNDVNGGRMVVDEVIELNYSGYNHGIERAIPEKYKGNPLRINILSVERDGAAEPYTTYGSNGNTVLRIGDADKTITGEHTYEIAYELRNVMSFYGDYDEWYWNINGTDWQHLTRQVSGEVVFPEGWSDEGLPAAVCYTGLYGSTAQNCTLSKTDRGYLFQADQELTAGETLSIVAAAPTGLFTPRTAADWWRENAWELVWLAAGLGLAGCAWLIWFKRGRDHKGRGVIIPEYEPPEGLSPTEVGLLADYDVDARDLTAAIIDLAIRGYIRIHEEVKPGSFLGIGKTLTFSLELINDDLKGLRDHEAELIRALFSPPVAGTKQEIGDIALRKRMSEAVLLINDKLKKPLTGEFGYFEKGSGKYTLAMVVVGLVLLFVWDLVFGDNLAGGWGWSIGRRIAGVSFIVFGMLMQRRTHAGVEAYEKIQGFKLYLNTAEKDRLKMLQSVDRPYAPPAQTVELFEKLLPYAVALGVEKSWAKQFANIYQQPPDWYGGNYARFSTGYLIGNLTRGVSAMNSSFRPPRSSGSSGFSSGGGFACGGGGGGGGGSW